MKSRTSMRGVAAAVGIFGALGASSFPAGAAPGRRWTAVHTEAATCAATRDRARERAQAGRLREAQELYVACARVACSEIVRQECTARHTQLAGDIPSIVPLVTDNAGAPRVLVEVRIDGQLVMSRLSGQAVSLDPGKHELSFSTDDGVFATRQVFVAQGERNRTLHVVLRPFEPAAAIAKVALVEPAAKPARPEKPARPAKKTSEGDDDDDDDEPTSVAATTAPNAPGLLGSAPGAVLEHHAAREPGSSAGVWTFGVLGLAGVGGYALLTSWGRADNRMLAGCSPNCPAASVQRVRRLYWGADASLGIGLASLAASTWMFAGRF